MFCAIRSMSLAGLMGRGAKGRSKLVQRASYMCQHGSQMAATSKANSGEAIGNYFQNSLLQNKVLLSLRTSRLPAWENKCKFSVGVGVLNSLFVSSSKFWWQKYWGSLPSIAQFSHLPQSPCATMQDFQRCKWRQYAPETWKISCVLGDSSR